MHRNQNLEAIKNLRQLYCCCGCSLRIGCILIGVIETCFPILLTCSPTKEPVFVIVLSWVLYISASIILLYGSIKGNTPVLIGWLVYRGIFMLFAFAGIIYQINEIYMKYMDKAKLIAFFITLMIFFYAVNVYFWTVVYSHYMELIEKGKIQRTVSGVAPKPNNFVPDAIL